jgi:hypothetical protein
MAPTEAEIGPNSGVLGFTPAAKPRVALGLRRAKEKPEHVWP